MFSVRQLGFQFPAKLFPRQAVETFFDFFPHESIVTFHLEGSSLAFCVELEWAKTYSNLRRWLTSVFQHIDYQVIISWTPLRKEAAHGSEMVSQLLMGEMFTGFFQWENFVFGYTEEGYWGYASLHGLKPFDKALYRDFKRNARYPIGSKSLVEPAQPVDLNSLIGDLLGVPYLWGGRSNWGIDCSGLTHLLMLAQNTILPRDAYQQADFGSYVPFGEQQFGDLAFFGKSPQTITHVGWIMDKHTILHAYGYVRIDTLTDKGIYHADYQQITHSLCFIKRYPSHFNFLHYLPKAS